MVAATALAPPDFTRGAWRYALIRKAALGNVSPIVLSEAAARRVDVIASLVVVVVVATTDARTVINRRPARHFNDCDALIKVRSRRTGSIVLIELELGFVASTTIGAIQPVIDALRQGIETDVINARATVIPRSPTEVAS